MSIGSSGGAAVKSATLLAAPLGLTVLARCRHLSLPRQLAVLLPYNMVPGGILLCFFRIDSSLVSVTF